MTKKAGYVIGSLKNPKIMTVAKELRQEGYEIFDDWYSAGPDADDIWRDHEREKGRDFKRALAGFHAQYAFQQDYDLLSISDFGVLVLPAGKSAHLELGWLIGRGTPGWILMDGEPERFDLMYKFAVGVCYRIDELKDQIKEYFGD